MKADKFNNLFFGVIIFLTFIGFYALLLLAINAGMSGFTRQLTIPIRGVIGFCSVLLFVYGAKNNASYVKWFIVFILIYITRIFIDYINNEFFYIPYQDLVFYFISFTLIPFLGISRVDWRKINFSKLYKAFLSSAFLFSLLTILLYGRFVGQVGRLNTTTVGESVISPLILSYCGALIIGVVATYLMYNRNQNKLLLLLSLATITMALVPFF